MSRFSRAEVEAQGWVIVHEDEGQGQYRAERIIDGVKVEQSGVSEGKLLEAISAYQAHLDKFLDPVPARVDESGMPLDEDGNIVRTVTAPNGEELSDAEWSHRGVGDVISRRDEETRVEGPSEAAVEAEEARREISAEKENQRTAEEEVGPTENLDTENRDRQLSDRLVVREGEGSRPEVVDRRLKLSAQRESDRTAAGLGIGPMDLDAEGNLVPPGGASSLSEPDGPDSAEEVVEAREEAEVDKAVELRDEHGKSADKPELAGEVAEAGSEAQQELADEKEEAADEEENGADVAPEDSEAPEATEAAVELAEEKGVDLSQVEGSGKDGKIIKSDVEAVAEENDPEE